MSVNLLFHNSLEILPTRQWFCHLHAETCAQHGSCANRVGDQLKLAEHRRPAARQGRTISAQTQQFLFDSGQLRVPREHRSFEVVRPNVTCTIQLRLGTETLYL